MKRESGMVSVAVGPKLVEALICLSLSLSCSVCLCLFSACPPIFLYLSLSFCVCFSYLSILLVEMWLDELHTTPRKLN